MEYSTAEKEQIATDENIIAISKQLIDNNHEAYETLAKDSK